MKISAWKIPIRWMATFNLSILLLDKYPVLGGFAPKCLSLLKCQSAFQQILAPLNLFLCFSSNNSNYYYYYFDFCLRFHSQMAAWNNLSLFMDLGFKIFHIFGIGGIAWLLKKQILISVLYLNTLKATHLNETMTRLYTCSQRPF